MQVKRYNKFGLQPSLATGITLPSDGLQGGAISYAAAVASAYGIRACVVTAAGPDADLSVFRGHDLHVVPTNHTLTFEHSYTWWGETIEPRLHVSWV